MDCLVGRASGFFWGGARGGVMAAKRARCGGEEEVLWRGRGGREWWTRGRGGSEGAGGGDGGDGELLWRAWGRRLLERVRSACLPAVAALAAPAGWLLLALQACGNTAAVLLLLMLLEVLLLMLMLQKELRHAASAASRLPAQTRQASSNGGGRCRSGRVVNKLATARI